MMIRPLLWLLFFTALKPIEAAEDFRPLVSEAIQRGKKRIVIAPGDYRLAPQSGGELWKLTGLSAVKKWWRHYGSREP